MNGTVVKKLDIRKISCDEFVTAYYLMSEERQKKCDGLRREEDKKLCIAADMLLRSMLGEVLKIPGKDLIFSKDENGKPYLSNGDCFFNISHSGDYVAVAVNKEKKVGIDIEKIRSIKTSLLTKVCTQQEILYIFGDVIISGECITDENMCERFFRVWTYKEAYLKLTGKGIVSDIKNTLYGEKNCRQEISDGYAMTVITE